MRDLSIITVNYNNLSGLKKTTQSVFSQDFSGYEYIVVDGDSTDGSREYLNEIEDKLSYSISERDNGVYHAMNKGISKATGKLLMFLNSGDFLIDTTILTRLNEYIIPAASDIYYGNIRTTDGTGNVSALKFPSELSLRFWKTATINHQASIIRSGLFTEVGLYDPNFGMAADYAFFLKCFFLGKRFQAIREEVVDYQLDGVSSLNEQEYKLQMNKAWNEIIPGYLDKLYKEKEAYELLLNQRILRWARLLNDRYKSAYRKNSR